LADGWQIKERASMTQEILQDLLDVSFHIVRSQTWHVNDPASRIKLIDHLRRLSVVTGVMCDDTLNTPEVLNRRAMIVEVELCDSVWFRLELKGGILQPIKILEIREKGNRNERIK
jgi:hypothetical protein